MSMQAGQLRKGNVVVLDGEPHRVLDYEHVKPGKGPAYLQTKLRNLENGVITDRRFRTTDTVERAAMRTRDLQFLYEDRGIYHFMDTETYEQSAMDEETLGEKAKWLTPNLVFKVEFYETKPIGIELPKTLELTVEKTAPGVKGDTKTSVTKPATLENGVTVQVPSFVDQGETIRVDPETEEYLERVR